MDWMLYDPQPTSLQGLFSEEVFSPEMIRLLELRGLSEYKDLRPYVRPEFGDLPSLDVCPGLESAARVLVEGILSGARILVWGDYDVDGVSASTLVRDILQFHMQNTETEGANRLIVHIPDRFREGYGINAASFEELLCEIEPEIVLTVDCGIVAVTSLEKAEKGGIRVVVTDHHQPGNEIPHISACCNPLLPLPDGSVSPWKGIAGVTVAFLVMARTNEILAHITGRSYNMLQALDLVCLGTIADVVPLVGPNRILAHYGLQAMEQAKRPGIAALKRSAQIWEKGVISSHQVAFFLAPRLNAAGRLEHARLSHELLCNDISVERARELAQYLTRLNDNRKTIERDLTYLACEQAEEQINSAGLVVSGRGWHRGVIGIVASRLVEQFGKPALVFSEEENGVCHGSGRIYPGLNLYDALQESSSVLLTFGGHAQAAGMKVRIEKLPELLRLFSNAVEDQKKKLNLSQPPLILDMEMSFSRVSNFSFLNEILRLEPFGNGNPQPKLASLPCILESRKDLGKRGEGHLKLSLRELDSGICLEGCAWRMADYIPADMVGKTVRVAYTPGINVWGKKTEIRLEILDCRQCEEGETIWGKKISPIVFRGVHL